MKIVEHYICESCGSDYTNKEKCDECEKNHAKPVKIIDYTFSQSSGHAGHYPSTIWIEMDNGEKTYYTR